MKFINFNTVKTVLSAKTSKAILEARKYAPDAMIVFGIGLMAAGAIGIGKASTKVNDISSDASGKLEALHQAHGEDEACDAKELLPVYKEYGTNLVKLYGGPVAMFASGAVLVLGGHYITEKRLAAVVGAYEAVSSAYGNYRENVRAVEGKEADEMYCKGDEAFRTAVASGENPKKYMEEHPIGSENDNRFSFLFDEFCVGRWESIPAYNNATIRALGSHLQTQINNGIPVTVNDIYREFCVPRKFWPKDGQLFGFCYDKKTDVNPPVLTIDVINAGSFFEGREPSVELAIRGYSYILDKAFR